MREPGADCPECGQAIFRGKCTACGWTATQKSGAPTKSCAACGETFDLWPSLTQGDDGIRRCATCHLAFLKARAARDPAPGKFEDILAMIEKKSKEAEARFRTTPSLLERMGVHPMRPSVVSSSRPPIGPITDTDRAELERRKDEARKQLEELY